jgi:hypothetical protein
MKKTILTICLAVSAALAYTQSLSFKANTGDTELDLTLNDINKQGTADFKLFKQDMSVGFGVTEGKIDELSVKFKMQPGDIYFALELAKQTGKTIDVVAKSWETNKGKGWGVIAKELGIKPGSKEFHALKNASKGKNDKMKGNQGKGGNGNSGKGGSPGNSGKAMGRK